MNSIFHLKDGKRSSFNLYERLNGVISNIRLQRSIAKSGITNFIFIIYYFHKDPLVILTDVETLRVFLLKICTILKKKLNRYKHTAEAIEKMIS
jgi:hypothetical protein